MSPSLLTLGLLTDNTPGETTQVNGQALAISGNGAVTTKVVPSAGATTTSAQVVLTEPNGATTAVGVTMVNNQPVSFDACGNTTSDNNYSYLSDGKNRPLVVNNGNGLPSGTADTLLMKYDGQGRRVGITALNAGGPVTSLNQLSGAATVSAKTYVWCGNRICEERDATGKQVLKRFFTNGEQDNGQNLYYTRDHLGSVRDVTDASGNIQAQYDYDPWGRQTQVAGAMQASFGYTGHFQEQTTGLTMAKYRIYNPEMGRWLSGDPKGQAAGPNVYGYVESVGELSLNLYEYANNNPLRFTDPEGLDPDGNDPNGGDPNGGGGGGAIVDNTGYGVPFGWDMNGDQDVTGTFNNMASMNGYINTQAINAGTAEMDAMIATPLLIAGTLTGIDQMVAGASGLGLAFAGESSFGSGLFSAGNLIVGCFGTGANLYSLTTGNSAGAPGNFATGLGMGLNAAKYIAGQATASQTASSFAVDISTSLVLEAAGF